MTESKIAEWYLAYLRKDALDDSSRDRTPLALVRADQELIKQKIEADLSASKNDSEPALSDSEKSIASESQLALYICIAISLYGLVQSSISKMYFLSALLLGTTVLLTNELRKQSSRSKQLDAEISRLSASYHLPALQKSCTGRLSKLLFWLEESINQRRRREELIFEYCPDVLVELDENLYIKKANKAAASALSLNEIMQTETSVLQRFAGQSAVKLKESLSRCRELSGPETIDLAIDANDGRRHYFSWRSEWSASARTYFCLGRDVTFQTEYELQKQEIRTMISHDLRAPLSGLSFWIDNMLSGCYGSLEADASLSLTQADRNLRNALNLLDDLLDVERLNSTRIKVQKTDFDLACVVQDLTESLQGWASSQNVALSADANSVLVNADKEHIKRILLNFTSNALRITPKGGKVIVRCKRDGAVAMIEVIDSGPGIKPELKEKLFERWVAGPDVRESVSVGFGLGLFICKRLAELNGASVGGENLSSGGARFWIQIFC